MAAEKVTYELSLKDLMSKGLTDINAKLGSMEKKLGETEKKASKSASGIGTAFKGLGSILGGIAVGAFVKDVVLATAKMQSLGNAIKFASDNSTQGELSLNWLQNFSGKWGVDMNAAAEGFKTFQGAMINTKFTSNEVRKMFEQVSMGGIAMGLSAEDTKGTFLALGQIMGKGKVQAEELRGQIGERVPGAFQIAARAMGVTTMELDKMMKEGKLLSEDFLPKFAAEMEKTFGAGALQQTDNLTANLNRATNAWLDLQVSMGESQGGVIAGTLQIWSNLVQTIADNFKTIDQLSAKNVNDDVVKTLSATESSTISLAETLKKEGKSKKEIEDFLKQQQNTSTQLYFARGLQLDDQIKAFEESKGGVGPSLLNPLRSEDADRKTYYNTFPEYRKLVDERARIDKLSLGSQGITDKAISNLYRQSPSAEQAELKKQASSVEGSVPKVMNITIEALIKDVKNYFSSGTNGVAEAKSFLDQLQQALTTIVTDVGIVSPYGR